MAFPLKENSTPGTSLRDLVTAEVMNTIAGILNNLQIDMVDGLEFPDILKTATPGPASPWVIRIPASTALNLSDAAPAADGTASAGVSENASRGDHVHPLNTDTTTPEPVGLTGDAGNSTKYSRLNHVHADKVPSNPASNMADLTLTAEGAAAANASYWVSGTNGLALTLVTRVRYNETDSVPAIVAYYRHLYFDKNGRLYSISTEGSFVVDQPVALTLS